MKRYSMKSLPLIFVVIPAVAFISCFGCSPREVEHYDVTQVDTMLAIDLGSSLPGDGTYVSSWTYLSDFVVASTQSAPNKKSQTTLPNRTSIRVRYLGRIGVGTCTIPGDDERFVGNSYDTTSYIRVYVYREEIGQFSYKPGISKQTGSTFVQTPEAFVERLRKYRPFKIETATFTGGTLAYSFDVAIALVKRKQK